MKKSTLYAPRLRGDIDLGLEPSRLDGAGGQLWAEINAPGGRLPGQAYQGHWEASTTQKYRIGSRRVVGDRTFHYAHALEGGGENVKQWGVANQNTVQERAGGTWAVDGVVGDMIAYINASVNDITLNQFAGGYLLYAEAVSGQGNQIPIISNTAATVGNASTVYLGHPLTGAATALATGATLTGSLWSNVDQPSHAGFETIVGIPIVDLPDNNYGWIQTWGPCLVVGTGPTGVNGNERSMYFNTDGSVYMPSSLSTNHQYAGVIATMNYYGAVGNSTNFIILQLFP